MSKIFKSKTNEKRTMRFVSNNKMSLIFLILFINLFYNFFFLFYGASYLVFGENRFGYITGYLVTTSIVVLLFYLYGKYKQKEEIMVSSVKSKLEIRYIDIIVLTLLYNILPYFLDKFYSIFSSSYYSSSSSDEVDYLLKLVSWVLVSPIVEEIIFRWLFFKLLDRLNFGKYDFTVKVTLNVSLFTIIHYGFDFVDIIDYSIYLISIPSWIFFGFIEFWIYHQSRKLKLSIFFHAFTNLFILLIRWFHDLMIKNRSDFRIKTEWLMIIAISMIIYLYYGKLKLIISNILTAIFSKNTPIFLLGIILMNLLIWPTTYLLFDFLSSLILPIFGLCMVSFAGFYSFQFLKLMKSNLVVQLFANES